MKSKIFILLLCLIPFYSFGQEYIYFPFFHSFEYGKVLKIKARFTQPNVTYYIEIYPDDNGPRIELSGNTYNGAVNYNIRNPRVIDSLSCRVIYYFAIHPIHPPGTISLDIIDGKEVIYYKR